MATDMHRNTAATHRLCIIYTRARILYQIALTRWLRSVFCGEKCCTIIFTLRLPALNWMAAVGWLPFSVRALLSILSGLLGERKQTQVRSVACLLRL